MQHRRLDLVLITFSKSIEQSKQLAANAHSWSGQATQPKFTNKHRDSITSLAFLRAFLAWETFLEQSFLLYLVGKVPPKGAGPYRYGVPPTYDAAHQMVKEGGRYSKWSSTSAVIERSDRFFRDGRPYRPILRTNITKFEELNTIRNAVAHAATSTGAAFETLVRSKLGSLPANVTVGSFLATGVPHSAPPISFFDFYLDVLITSAQRIIPS